MQYLRFSVFSEFLHKTVGLAILPPPTLYKFKTGQNFGYARPTFFVGWGKGLGLCELEKVCKVEDAQWEVRHNGRAYHLHSALG